MGKGEHLTCMTKFSGSSFVKLNTPVFTFSELSPPKRRSGSPVGCSTGRYRNRVYEGNNSDEALHEREIRRKRSSLDSSIASPGEQNQKEMELSVERWERERESDSCREGTTTEEDNGWRRAIRRKRNTSKRRTFAPATAATETATSVPSGKKERGGKVRSFDEALLQKILNRPEKPIFLLREKASKKPRKDSRMKGQRVLAEAVPPPPVDKMPLPDLHLEEFNARGGDPQRLATFPSSGVASGKREYVVREIIATERSYVSGLQVLIEEYQKPLREQRIISKAESTDIFGQVITSTTKVIYMLLNSSPQIQSIQAYNAMLLTSLEERATSWNTESVIGDIFMHTVRFPSESVSSFLRGLFFPFRLFAYACMEDTLPISPDQDKLFSNVKKRIGNSFCILKKCLLKW